jgi:hypothetical protein
MIRFYKSKREQIGSFAPHFLTGIGAPILRDQFSSVCFLRNADGLPITDY